MTNLSSRLAVNSKSYTYTRHHHYSNELFLIASYVNYGTMK